MRFVRPALVLLPTILSCVSVAAQTPPRDPLAIVQLQRAVTAMGGTVPSDSVATGAITIVAGSTPDTGTVRILTRGLDQTAEQVDTPRGRRAIIYSRGRAAEVQGDSSRRLHMELVVTSQTPNFPLIPLARALNDATIGVQYVGSETLEGVAVHHIRIWDTFTHQRLAHLAEVSRKDLWINAATGRPRKISYERRSTMGSAPASRFDVLFSDYRPVGTLQYPFLIQKSVIGTPFITITIQNVILNAGLSDGDFPVPVR